MTHVEAVVVGGGPIGIETAIALRHRGIDAVVLESGALGHTVSWWAPQTRWFSSNDRIAIAGVPLHTVDQSKASREEYLNYLRTVVDQFDVPVETFSKVVSIEPIAASETPAWQVAVASNQPNFSFANEERKSGRQRPTVEPIKKQIRTNAVVLAIGGTDYPNRLGVPGEKLPHVDGYLREVHRYHGQRVMIVGGRNSAVEAAIRLHRGGAKVSLSYHRESLPTDGIKYWLRPEIEGLIRSGSVEAWMDSKVVRFEPGAVVLQTRCSEDDAEEDHAAERRIEVDHVLTLIGYQQNQDLFRDLGILSDEPEPKPIFDEDTMQSPRSGIYIAGTAIGGTQSSKYQVFVENCHDHPIKIADHLAERMGWSAKNQSHVAENQINRTSDSLRRRIGLQPES